MTIFSIVGKKPSIVVPLFKYFLINQILGFNFTTYAEA